MNGILSHSSPPAHFDIRQHVRTELLEKGLERSENHHLESVRASCAVGRYMAEGRAKCVARLPHA